MEEDRSGQLDSPARGAAVGKSIPDKPLKVLVVDDDESTARMIRILIERAFNTQVEIALDFASAKERFASEKFDLVTLDYQLRDGDGLDLLQEFKKEDDSPPVILVTGRGDEHVAARAFLLGASGYVIKDLRLNTMLAAAVHKALTEIALKKAEAAVLASETRLTTIIDTTLEGIWIVDSAYVTTYANQAMVQMLGLDSVDELIGRSAFELFFEEDLPAMERLTERRTRKKTKLEIRLRKKDGLPAWGIVTATGTFNEKNELQSAFAMLTDITDRKLAEEALRIEKDRAQLYLDTVGVVLVALDADGKITLINRTGLELLGYEQSDLLGKNWFDVCIPDRHKDQVLSTHQNMLSGRLEIAEYFENPVVTRSGEEKLIAWQNAALRDDDGNITGTLSSGEDVTERLKAQEELRVAAVRAETLSRLSKELVEASLDFEATLGVIARNVADLVGDGCIISLISEDGERLEAYAIEHVNPDARVLAQTLVTSYPLRSIKDPFAAALSTGESQLVPVVDQGKLNEYVNEGFWPYVERYGICSIIVVPLRAKGKTIGTFGVLRDEPGESYTEDDLLLLEEIAYFAATTIDSARAHNQLQDELAIREEREKELRVAAVRAETLSRLSKELVDASLDYEATLGVIARNVADLIGDGCFISLISEDGERLEASAIEHVNLEARDLAKKLIKSYHFTTADDPVAEALSTGESQLIPLVDQEELMAVVSHEFFPYIERYGIHSIIVVPLRVKGKTIGTVTLLRDEPGKPYMEHDLLLMEEIAYFAATTIDSARAHNQLQDELAIREKREKELEAANAELEGFAHTVSHDLQGPISATKLGLDLLRDELLDSDTGWSTEKLNSFMGPLLSNMNTCISLVESLLELAESGPVPQEVSVVQIGGILHQCVESYAATIAKRGIEVEVDPEMGQIVANPTHVYQLFSNLIGNAVIHNKASKPRLEVHHLDDSEEGAQRYLVRDNGDGIPENYLGKLFTPFFRAEGGGTVIGLAIVDKVLKAYGGEIKAYNDNGACFEFTIRDFKAI